MVVWTVILVFLIGLLAWNLSQKEHSILLTHARELTRRHVRLVCENGTSANFIF